eukprot:TRINITY_DN1225_c0_g5_i1.p1 TRINITY_DN1225_c0_g5~~TRINITY_DN1225_c0_g5_i1.p1  ORF type:complete len:442 (+),score=69.35 TRINITY_DN1225_c0_g5_i1:358-1683(+)
MFLHRFKFAGTLVLLLMAVMVPNVTSKTHDNDIHLGSDMTTRELYSYTTEPYNEIQEVFAALPLDDGWLGADVSNTIPLGNGSSVWLFGDTLIGSVTMTPDGLLRNVKAMPRNSIGVSDIVDKNSSFSSPSIYTYVVPNNVSVGFFTPDIPGSWFWVTAGELAMERLYLFAQTVRSTNQPGAFGFDVFTTTLIVVENPMDSPNAWEYTYYDLGPLTFNNTLSWAVAAFADDDSESLYVYGRNQDDSTAMYNDAVLMRFRYENMLLNCFNASCIEYWGVDEPGGHPMWTAAPVRMVSLFSDAPPETTVTYNTFMGAYVTLSIPFLKSEVTIRTATNLTGPWSDAASLYNIPYPFNDTAHGVFCYAPKLHREIDPAPTSTKNVVDNDGDDRVNIHIDDDGVGTNDDSSFVFSFMSNAYDINYVLNHTQLYVPQFIRVNITQLA